jgi:hypothetical protein
MLAHVTPNEVEKAVDYSADELDGLIGRDDKVSGVDSEVESVMDLVVTT